MEPDELKASERALGRDEIDATLAIGKSFLIEGYLITRLGGDSFRIRAPEGRTPQVNPPQPGTVIVTSRG